MPKEQFSMRNLSVFFLAAAELVMVAILVWNRPSSAGTGATGAPQAVHVVHASAGPGHANAASLPTNVGMGYAAILKPALSAVVNISSSRVVKAPQYLSSFSTTRFPTILRQPVSWAPPATPNTNESSVKRLNKNLVSL